MGELYVHNGTTWKTTKDIKVNVAGTWRRVNTGYVRDGSTWREFYKYDSTGPTAVTSSQAKWNNTYGPRCYVSWYQPNVSDFSYSLLERSVGGAAYTTIGTYGGSPASYQQYIDTSVTLSNYWDHGLNQASAIHYYRVTPYDNRGNAGTPTIVSSTGQNSSVVRGYLTSPYKVYPSYVYTYFSGPATWASGAAYQGYTSFLGLEESFGTFFYDTNRRTGLNISASSVLLHRDTSTGIDDPLGAAMWLSKSSGVTVFVNGSPASDRLTTGTVSTLMAKGGTVFGSIPTSWASALMNSTTVGGYTPSSIQLYTGETENYGFFAHSLFHAGFDGLNYEDGFGNYGGTLFLTHSG